MLKTLRRIIQEVNRAPDLTQALQLTVSRVRSAIDTEVCSIYLTDEHDDSLVLMASEGLNQSLVGKLRLTPSQGLVGLVARREEPINLNNAPEHPNFFFVKDIGEEPYQAFLGVPIIHNRHVLGVMVVQQRESRRFDQSEEAFLVTLSAQLASVIMHAESVSNLSQKPASPIEVRSLTGVAGAQGISVGKTVILLPQVQLDMIPDRQTSDVEQDVEFFYQALEAARSEVQALSNRLKGSLPDEEWALFDVYLMILDKHGIGREVEDKIRGGLWAASALRQVVAEHISRFENMNDSYLSERASDIRDLGSRVLNHLVSGRNNVTNFDENTVLVGEEVTANMLAEVPEEKLAGIISLRGSVNSHMAILARAMGVPAVVGVQDIPLNQLDGRDVILDGYTGKIYISPTDSLLNVYRRLMNEEQEMVSQLAKLRDQEASTPDGFKINLLVNTGLIADVEPSLHAGAQGVGLYRTEIPFMVRDRFPTEEEQSHIYREMLRSFTGLPVVMRTLDVGGDKALPYFPVVEDNPFLGWRGVRITIDHPELFLVQVRAMMKANIGLNNLRILLPMISNVEEVDECRRLIHQAYQEVIEELERPEDSFPFPEVGVMVETPAAVYQAPELAKRVDFLSVGSNDLTQYLLAVDRNNARVAHLYDALHPAVIKAMGQVVAGAALADKPVSICGELAGDPAAAVLLMGMGFDSFSMNAISIPKVKWVIRNFSIERAKSIYLDTLEMETAKQIRDYLEDILDQHGLGGLIRAGK
ncbi:MAG: phosphoenolpyruvate--protein phosphotransferase [Kangiellaceae bacterium]|nr:phosphoenolpyruvate--protein phosphotransferase [Kangiellaceae bacterium]|tara:strand:- start:17590 stop:19863 length:2274 start_codon:yes stop_codon:yes gene_type:complete